jgi:hypothetical protein
MGAHRKPKSRPTAVAAVVTAAIVVPTSTAAASLGAFGAGPSSSGDRGANAASLAGRQGMIAPAASTASKSQLQRATLVSAPIAGTSASSAAAKSSTVAKAIAQTLAAPSAAATTAAAATAQAAAAAVAAPASQAKSLAASSTTSAAAQPASIAPDPDPYANLTIASLEPTGLYGSQQHFSPSSTQWANAKTIVSVAKQRGMAPYAAVIAIATAMQESSLTNLTQATNYDSLGLFQQRPSMGWGTATQLTDPAYATNAFLSALETYAPHYESQALWSAAQAVQRSGFPTAYAQWESQAARMVQAIANGSV